jgi:hypothetical protein
MTRLLSIATLAVCLIFGIAHAASYSDLVALPFGKRLTNFAALMDTYFASSQGAGGRAEARAESHRMCLARARMNDFYIIEDVGEIVARRPELGTVDVLAILLRYLTEFCDADSGMSFHGRRDRAVKEVVSNFTF